MGYFNYKCHDAKCKAKVEKLFIYFYDQNGAVTAGLDAATSGFFFGGIVGKELEVDLDEDHEVDEDESHTYARYLAQDVVSWITHIGSKGYPFLRSTQGTTEGGRRQPPGEPRQDLRSTY